MMVKLFQGPGQPPPQSQIEEVPVPEGVKQIAGVLKASMPIIEEITGMNRKEITGHFLKVALKGNWDSLLSGWLGKPQTQELVWIRKVKALAFWGPIGLGILAFIVTSLYFYVVFLGKIVGKM